MCFGDSINLMLSGIWIESLPRTVFMKSWVIVDRQWLHMHTMELKLKRHMHGLTNEMITCCTPMHACRLKKANCLAEFQFDWQTPPRIYIQSIYEERKYTKPECIRDDDVFIMNINADESLMLCCRCVNYVLCTHSTLLHICAPWYDH